LNWANRRTEPDQLSSSLPKPAARGLTANFRVWNSPITLPARRYANRPIVGCSVFVDTQPNPEALACSIVPKQAILVKC
jgi:hypothetical protein